VEAKLQRFSRVLMPAKPSAELVDTISLLDLDQKRIR
jgi:hypothetical protein